MLDQSVNHSTFLNVKDVSNLGVSLLVTPNICKSSCFPMSRKSVTNDSYKHYRCPVIGWSIEMELCYSYHVKRYEF